MAKKPQPLALLGRGRFLLIDHSLTKGRLCLCVAFDYEDRIAVVLWTPTATWVAVSEHNELLRTNVILFHEGKVNVKVRTTATFRHILNEVLCVVVCDLFPVVDVSVKAPQVNAEVLVLVHDAFDL